MFGTFFDGRFTADGNVKPDKTDKVSKGIETGRFDTSLTTTSIKLSERAVSKGALKGLDLGVEPPCMLYKLEKLALTKGQRQLLIPPTMANLPR